MPSQILQQPSKNTKVTDHYLKVEERMDLLAERVKTTLKLFTRECDNRLHEVDDEVISELEEKHSEPVPIEDSTLLYGPTENLLPTYFDSIDEGAIFKAACLAKGAYGLSHMDADQFQHILTSKIYKKENKDLRDQITILARKLACKIVDLNSLD